MAKKSLSTKRNAPAASRSNAAKTKTDTILGLLRRKNGATIAEMAKATDWQTHSVRGFLSGTVKRKLGLKLADEKPEGGVRRYFIKSSS